MKRLVGLSSQQLETREGVMEGLARNGLAAAVKAVTLNAELVTAATGPVPMISTTASGVTASLAPVELTAATNSWSAYVDAVLYPFLLETYMASAQQTYQFIDGTLHVATPEVIPLTAEDYLRAAVNRLKNVGALLWSSIRDSLAQGYEAGETTHQLAQRIRAVAKDVSESRAITIARTEVISAANAASQAQVELGGFSDSECRKQWLATEDERTRATHRLADGQSVGLSESFFVGGEYLQFPGAPTGRADNVINCRCTVEYVFVEDGDLDGLQASGGWIAPSKAIYALADGGLMVAADAPGDLDWEGWNAGNPKHPKDSKGKWTDTPDGIEQLPIWEKMTPEQIDTWYKNITQAEWDATDPEVKEKIQSHVALYYDIGGLAEPKNKVKLLDAGEGPGSAAVAPLTVPKWSQLMPHEIEQWYDNVTLEQWLATPDDVKKELAKHSTLFFGFHSPKNKVKNLIADEASLPASQKTSPATPSLKSLSPKTLVVKTTPLHVNTNVIYKQKYADNAVIAVHPGTNGQSRRILWNENTKKFDLQVNANSTWFTTASYGKGEAYKKFSKETGWLTPDSTLPALSVPAATTLPSATPSGTYFGKPILSSGDFKQASWTEKVGWLKAAGPAELDVFSVYGLEKLEQQVHEMYLKDDLSGPDYQIAADKISAAKLAKTGGASVPTPPIITTPKQITPLEDFGWQKEFGTNAISFDSWFALNLLDKKGKWDQLSSNDKKLIEAAAFNATIFGYDTPSLTISKWAGIDTTGSNPMALHDKIEGMTNGEFAGWLGPNVDQTMWNGLAPETKDLMEQKANTLSAMGYSGPKNMVNVLKANDPAGASLFPTSAPPASVPPSFNVSVDDSDISGPNGTTPAKDLKGNTIAWVDYTKDGSGAFVYGVGPNGGQGNYVGSVDFEDGEVLEASISAFISTGALNPSNNVPGSPKAPPTVKPPLTPPAAPSAPPPHGYNQHLLATQTVTFVGDIGQPDTGVKNFKSISTDEMKKLQHEMLLLSDKKKWSSEEKNAVGFYGTSTGYQSMNAVLRNDEKRLKLFSEPQLSQAVQSATHVQSAMTPLTTSLELHRGTGAQQFGFKTKSVSTDKLKKLEGQTIVDRGFVSTSVVPPTAISYDYAKKPVKVIIKAPKGTPAVYVDSVKPGHGENELLLGAGTNFHVDEVREASAADKALYGDHTEQVVTLTVVPATKVGPKDISSKATPSKSATVTTGAPPSLTPKPSPATPTVVGGKPIKLNTNVIYKQSYANGAVVAVNAKPMADGHQYRLVWHEPQKKFFLQLQQVDGAWINAANLSQFKFTKKDAFAKFSGDPNWVTPNPGDTALGTSGWPAAPVGATPSTTAGGPYDHILPGLHVGAKIKTVNENGIFKGFTSGSTQFVDVQDELGDVTSMHMGDVTGFDSSPSVPTPPAPKPVKAPKFDAAQLQAMHGVPPNLDKYQLNHLWSSFKYGGTPTTIHSQPAQIFKKLHKAVEVHNKSYNEKLNLLQALKLIDERASLHIVGGNQNAFEKKIVDWLQTPSGKTTATKVISPSSFPSKAPGTGSTDTVAGILFKVRDPSEIGTPHTKHVTFHPISHNDAQTMQIGMEAAEPLTESQRHGVLAYTNSGDLGYVGINGVLRGKKTLDSSTNLTAARSAVKAQAGMRALPRDILVYRKTGAAQFPNLTNSSGYADIKKFENKVFQDKGFLSTSIEKGTWSGNVHIEIEVPKGTPGIYTGGTWPDGRKRSNHASEMELILAAGLRYRVLKVEQGTGSVTRVRLRVEP